MAEPSSSPSSGKDTEPVTADDETSPVGSQASSGKGVESITADDENAPMKAHFSSGKAVESVASNGENEPVEAWSAKVEERFLEAAADGDVELLTRLHNVYPDNLRAAHPDTLSTLHEALIYACLGGHLDAVKFLTELWPDEDIEKIVNFRHDHAPYSLGHTFALHQAAERGACDVIAYLIEVGADPMRRDSKGNTALHCACKVHRSQAVRTIIESYSDRNQLRKEPNESPTNALINAQDSVGMTCLHTAAARDDAIIVAYLLEIGVRKDIKNSDNRTAWEVVTLIKARANSESVFALKQNLLEDLEWRYFINVNRMIYDWEGYGRRPYIRNLILASMAKRCWVHVPINKRTRILASLQDILRRSNFEPGRHFLSNAIRFASRHFLEDYEANGFLKVREPGCIWEYLGTYNLNPGNVSQPDLDGATRTWTFSDALETVTANFCEDDESAETTWLHGQQHGMSLVMPYLFSSSLKSVAGRLVMYNRLTESSEICHSDQRDLHGVHLPLTLDEYCNPALPRESLEKRNQDQVLVRKAFKGKSNDRDLSAGATKSDDKNPKVEQALHECRIITVHQLWLWKLGKIVIVSLPQDAVRTIIARGYSSGSVDIAGDDHNLRIAFFLTRLINSLDRPAQAGLTEPPLNTYANEIDAVLESVQQYAQGEGVDDLQIQKEKQFFHEIGDVRDELSMIKSVILQQEEVWREFAYSVWPECWPEGQDGRFRVPSDSTDESLRENWRIIARPLQLIQKYKRKIDRLDAEAARVEASITTLLDLKSKHASIKETHAAAIMSAAIFGFTIITIIFTPLGFVTGLFSLPIEGFQNGGSRYTGSYIGTWAVATEIVSVALTLFLMWAAVRFGMGVHLFTREDRSKERKELKKSSINLEARVAGSGSSMSEERKTSKDRARKKSMPREPSDDMV